MPLKTYPGYTFGAFREDQVSDVLAEKYDLILLRIVSMNPLRITMSHGSGPAIDLSRFLDTTPLKAPEARPTPSSGH